MSIGLIGRKVGMTQVFQDDGTMIPVSVVAIQPNTVTRLRTPERDGYAAIQLGTEPGKKLTKPETGQLRDLPKVAVIREFRVDDLAPYEVGQTLDVSFFAPGDLIDVTGTSKGKGFAGTIKRHNFQSQDATHGNSVSHRAPGSIGQRQTPGRVFKGKRMSGHMGNVARCTANLAVVRVDKDRNLLLIQGAVPGHAGSPVLIKPAAKVRRKRKG